MHKKLSDKTLVDLYEKQGLTTAQIGRRYGYTRERIRQRLRALGITKVNSRKRSIEPETLRHLYVDLRLPKDEITASLGISRTKLDAELQLNNIRRPRVTEHAASVHNRSVVEDLYIKQGLSQVNCANRLGIDVQIFQRLLKRFGIASRQSGRPGTRSKRYMIRPEELKRLYVDEGLTMASIAEIYGCSRPVISRNLKRLGLLNTFGRNHNVGI